MLTYELLSFLVTSTAYKVKLIVCSDPSDVIQDDRPRVILWDGARKTIGMTVEGNPLQTQLQCPAGASSLLRPLVMVHYAVLVPLDCKPEPCRTLD